MTIGNQPASRATREAQPEKNMTDDVPAICCGGGPVDPKAVSVYDEATGRNVCGLCGSADLQPGYGLGGGGGIGAYNFCQSCERILDKTEDRS